MPVGIHYQYDLLLIDTIVIGTVPYNRDELDIRVGFVAMFSPLKGAFSPEELVTFGGTIDQVIDLS